MKIKKPVPVEISRETLEQTAQIVGEHSASALILAAAHQHRGPVRFWKVGQRLILEKFPSEEN